MQLVGPRLALRAFAQTGGSQPPCLFGLVPLCNDRLAQADVVALSEVTPPWGFGENPGVDELACDKRSDKKSGQSLHKGTQGKKRRKRQRKKRGERRGDPDACPLPKETRGEACHESQKEGISRRGRHTQRSRGLRTSTALPIKRWRPKPCAERTRCKWLVLSGSRT